MSIPVPGPATALWLVDHTALSFGQIATFCDIPLRDVQAIADGELATDVAGRDPLAAGTLTKAEIDRCTNDPKARLGRFKPPLRRPDSFAAALNAIADGLAVVPPADVETARSAAEREQRKAQLTDRGICPICRVYVGKGVASHAAVCRGRIASDL